jgi:hypothetical protein
MKETTFNNKKEKCREEIAGVIRKHFPKTDQTEAEFLAFCTPLEDLARHPVNRT